MEPASSISMADSGKMAVATLLHEALKANLVVLERGEALPANRVGC